MLRVLTLLGLTGCLLEPTEPYDIHVEWTAYTSTSHFDLAVRVTHPRGETIVRAGEHSVDVHGELANDEIEVCAQLGLTGSGAFDVIGDRVCTYASRDQHVELELSEW